MEWLGNVVDFILDFDVYLKSLIEAFGPWIYVILFLIITGETGLVIAPLLPGDSLLFAAGTFAALPGDDVGGEPLLNVWVIFFSLCVAAVLGDAINYAVGRYLGPRLFRREQSRFFKRENLDRTHVFFEKYGPITIVIARFMPFLRTFAPFVAGVAEMTRSKFTAYNVGGAILWVCGLTLAGYLFGNLPWVQENLSAIIWAMIIVPGLIVLFGAWKARRTGSTA